MSLVIAVKLQEWFTKWQELSSKFTHKMNELSRILESNILVQ